MLAAMDYLVFGFGSLINSRSRARTLGECPAWPVRVAGLRRGWYAPSSRIRHTALGVLHDANAACNGVLAPLPAERLPARDAREAQYRRVEVKRDRVQALAGTLPSGRVVTYLPIDPRPPDAEHPIIRSYVDVTLSGCLEHGEAFAQEMLRTTDAWNEHLEDERHAPRYPLHEAHAPKSVLDRLLGALLDEDS